MTPTSDPDNLRDRISVTQQAHIFCITECSCGHRFPWEKSTEWRERAEWAWARHVADAVIRELGLRREADDKANFRMEPSRHRYVTDWIASDE